VESKDSVLNVTLDPGVRSTIGDRFHCIMFNMFAPRDISHTFADRFNSACVGTSTESLANLGTTP